VTVYLEYAFLCRVRTQNCSADHAQAVYVGG
jgi:hypothetical protein